VIAQWLAAVSAATAIAMAGRPRPADRLAAWRDWPPAGPRSPNLPKVSVSSAETDGSRRFGDRGTWWVAAIVGSALVAARVPPVVAAGLAVAALLVRRIAWSRRAARARQEATAATVEITFALAGELRAGRTPSQALAAVAGLAGPLRPALEAAHAAVTVGSDAADELARAAVLPGAERLRLVAAAWAVAESAGGRVAVVLERLSEAMDDDEELRQELDAAMAGPRATMAVLAGLPVLGLALGQAVGAAPLHLLLHRPLGWALLVAAVLLDGLGVVVTRAIARRALRP
jgi:tight adherence protein B